MSPLSSLAPISRLQARLLPARLSPPPVAFSAIIPLSPISVALPAALGGADALFLLAFFRSFTASPWGEASERLPGISWPELLIWAEQQAQMNWGDPAGPLDRRPAAGKLVATFRAAVLSATRGHPELGRLLRRHPSSLARLRPLAITGGYAATWLVPFFPESVGQQVSLCLLRHQARLATGEAALFLRGELTRPMTFFRARALPQWRRGPPPPQGGATLPLPPPPLPPACPSSQASSSVRPYAYRCSTPGCQHVHVQPSRPAMVLNTYGHLRYPYRWCPLCRKNSYTATAMCMACHLMVRLCTCLPSSTPGGEALPAFHGLLP